MFSRDKVAAQRRGGGVLKMPLFGDSSSLISLQGPRSDVEARPDKCVRAQRRTVRGRAEIRAVCDKVYKVFRFFLNVLGEQI